VTEILKQGQFVPAPMEDQVVILYAAVNELLNDIPVEKIQEFEQEFCKYMNTSQKGVLEDIAKTGDLSSATESKLKKAIEEFKKTTNFVEKKEEKSK